MRPDPLSFLTTELDTLKAQGLYRRLRILSDEQKAKTTVDDRQVVNLSSNNYLGSDDASAAARARAGGDPPLRRRFGLGAPDRRHARHPHGARTPAGGLQADRSGRRLPERVHRQRRNGLGDPDQGRRRDLRRAESREHHRRLPPQPRLDQGVPAQGRRRGAQDSGAAAILAAQAPHHRRRVQHGRRPRPAAGAVRAGRGIRLHHDGRRCACERRVRPERPRHHRSLRRARAGRHPGRHAVEGDRRARRIRRRQPRADRVPLSPRAAVPVLDLASAGRRRRVHRGDRRAARGAGDHRAAVGQHALLQGRPPRRSASTPASAKARSRR